MQHLSGSNKGFVAVSASHCIGAGCFTFVAFSRSFACLACVTDVDVIFTGTTVICVELLADGWSAVVVTVVVVVEAIIVVVVADGGSQRGYLGF